MGLVFGWGAGSGVGGGGGDCGGQGPGTGVGRGWVQERGAVRSKATTVEQGVRVCVGGVYKERKGTEKDGVRVVRVAVATGSWC